MSAPPPIEGAPLAHAGLGAVLGAWVAATPSLHGGAHVGAWSYLPHQALLALVASVALSALLSDLAPRRLALSLACALAGVLASDARSF
ncbi:MAG TPA: hypothetical protein VHH36_02250 [Candidatus Thermoplasmatota archaeon]|nr:hypothetical protein [Candidatus Thermoplasmatota archaeon]